MAYEIGYDIVVEDDNFSEVKEKCDTKTTEIEGLIDEFVKILEEITDKGVKSGEFHDKIELFTEQVRKLKGETTEITEKAKEQVDNFLDDFDTADNYLYYSK